MPVERSTYKTPFHKGKQPQWLCPTCRMGILRGVKESFHYKESTRSKNAREDPNGDWEPDWMEYTYACTLACTNPQCEETISSVGTGSVDYDIDYDESTGEPVGQNFYDYFQPKFFWPHLRIFDIPKNTPKAIKAEIERSFELFFASPSSSAGHVRIALEKILDHLKIKRNEIKKKKRVFINLHRRILLLPSSQNELKELFFAIKWLGNTGSHAADITMDDVMDAYDILEVALHEIFEKRTKTIKKLARLINRKRGPQKIKK